MADAFEELVSTLRQASETPERHWPRLASEYLRKFDTLGIHEVAPQYALEIDKPELVQRNLHRTYRILKRVEDGTLRCIHETKYPNVAETLMEALTSGRLEL